MSKQLQKLQQRAAELGGIILGFKKDKTAVVAATVSEKRALTDEEKGKLVALDEKIHAHEEQLANVQAAVLMEQDVIEGERAQAAAQAARPNGGSGAGAGDPDSAEGRRAHLAGGVVPGRVNADDDPKKGFRSHREFFASVISAEQLATHGRADKIDDRLKSLQVKGSGLRAALGSDEQSGQEGQYGAFLIPMGFSPDLLSITPEEDPTAGLVTEVPMALPSLAIPARVDKDHSGGSVSGGLVVTRRRETVEGTSSRMSLDGVVLNATMLFALSYTTEEILTDSPISFIALLGAGFQDQFAAHRFNEKLNGKGGGEPLGIMNSPCLVSVSKETGQAAKTIVTENIDKMVARCWKYGRAIWIANHDCFPQLMGLTRAIGTGGAVVNYLQWSPTGGMTLLGRPLYLSEFPQTLGTKGDLILGVWSEMLHGSYQPLESAESIHVRFTSHERTFKFFLRDTAQSWWKSALTPRVSTDTLSPFVVLNSRA